MKVMTGINSGKRFEQNWKNSIPKDVFYYRFRDGSSSWGGNDKVRFQQTNICDCLMFDGDYLYLLELKSTKGKSLPFSNIKKHQIKDLLWASKYANTICGLVVDFIEISRFKAFYDSTNRKSIPIDYLREKGIKIGVEKKKVNSKFDIKNFINNVIESVI